MNDYRNFEYEQRKKKQKHANSERKRTETLKLFIAECLTLFCEEEILYKHITVMTLEGKHNGEIKRRICF